jgi:hypothetical protein
MAEDSKQREPMPPALWWMIGIVGICFLVICNGAGLNRAIWLFGLPIGFVIAAIVSLLIRDSLGYENGFYGLADLVMRSFWTIAALLSLFALLVAGSIVLGPVFSAVSPFAHALGWIVIAGGSLWLLSKYLKEKESIKEAERDRCAQMKFEKYLANEEPDKYRIYQIVRDRYIMDRTSSEFEVHWHKIAQEAGVSIFEIIKITKN